MQDLYRVFPGAIIQFTKRELLIELKSDWLWTDQLVVAYNKIREYDEDCNKQCQKTLQEYEIKRFEDPSDLTFGQEVFYIDDDEYSVHKGILSSFDNLYTIHHSLFYEVFKTNNWKIILPANDIQNKSIWIRQEKLREATRRKYERARLSLIEEEKKEEMDK
ncbi:hypothetical protein TVAGG3_0918760 [Trichomonas vaginalis G3]|nr:hypothetical protein TVAGG3_0918760 [Trichomonas vaginalis G3]KAI5484996.1 hypothetical protein TVAGG3_0918760 [Trichomonas vaginalis G3]